MVSQKQDCTLKEEFREYYKQKGDITIRQIYSQLPIPTEIQNKILDLELLVESQNLVVNPQTEEWINIALRMKKEVILISDMYLSRDQISQIGLSKVNGINKIKSIFVSCDIGMTKQSGKLFLHALKKLSIQPKDLLHIGDNEHSDHKIPISIGVRTFLYKNCDYVTEVERREHSYFGGPLQEGSHARRIAEIQNPFDDELEKILLHCRFIHNRTCSLGILYLA